MNQRFILTIITVDNGWILEIKRDQSRNPDTMIAATFQEAVKLALDYYQELISDVPKGSLHRGV